MLLEKFSLPETDIRLITINDTIYKIKVFLVKPPGHLQSVCDQTAFCSNQDNQENIERVIVAILTSGESLQPLQTNNFVAYPYRKKWQIEDKLLFYRHEKCLNVSPYVYMFYIVENLNAKKNQQQEANNIQYVSETSDIEDSPQSPSILNGCKVDVVEETSDVEDSIPSPSMLTGCEIDVIEETDIEEMGDSPQFEEPHLTPKPDVDEANEENPVLEMPELVVRRVTEYKPRKRHQELVSKSPSMLTGCEIDVIEETDIEETGDSPQFEEPHLTPKPDVDEANEENPVLEMPELVVRRVTQYKPRKRHQELVSEDESKRKRYSVSDYVDNSRHEVEEQDLQEQLRLQELATPVQTENTESDVKENRFKQIMSSVKRLMFG